MFKSKRKQYKKTIEEYEKKSVIENKYYLLSSDFFKDIVNNNELDDKNLEFFYDICKEWDDYGSIELEVGHMLESLIKNPDYRIGIHRTPSFSSIDAEGNLHSELANDIFENGLINNGDLSSGVVNTDVPEPSKTVSPINNIMDAVMYFKASYKQSNIGVLAAFPTKYVDKELNFNDNYAAEIYNTTDIGAYTQYSIKPKYLIGVVYQDHGNCKFFTKDEVKQTNKGKLEVI